MYNENGRAEAISLHGVIYPIDPPPPPGRRRQTSYLRPRDNGVSGSNQNNQVHPQGPNNGASEQYLIGHPDGRGFLIYNQNNEVIGMNVNGTFHPVHNLTGNHPHGK